MKRRNSKWIKTLYATFIMAILPCIIFAQTPPSIFEDPDAPIDGGLSILLAAGVGYGIKKAKDQRKKNALNKTENSNS